MRVKNIFFGVLWTAVAIYLIVALAQRSGGWIHIAFTVVAVIAAGLYFYFAFRKQRGSKE